MVTYAAVVRACGKGWKAVWALRSLNGCDASAPALMVTYTAVVCACRNGWMAVCALLSLC